MSTQKIIFIFVLCSYLCGFSSQATILASYSQFSGRTLFLCVHGSDVGVTNNIEKAANFKITPIDEVRMLITLGGVYGVVGFLYFDKVYERFVFGNPPRGSIVEWTVLCSNKIGTIAGGRPELFVRLSKKGRLGLNSWRGDGGDLWVFLEKGEDA